MTDPRCWREGCAHGLDVHTHHRYGSDCSLCGCRAFKKAPLRQRLGAAMAAWRMREPIRLDAEDEVGMHPLPQLPCWEQEPAGFYYCLLPAGHGGDHMAEDGDHTILAVWGA